MKSAALQDQINELDQFIQGGGSDAQLNLWEMQRKELQNQLQAAFNEEAQQQERVQAQEAEVESITLPYDYNEILGNSLANETIIELLQQGKRQANEERNTLVDEMNAIFKQRLDELTNEWAITKTQLQTVNGELQNKLDAENEQAQKDAIELNALTQQVAQLGLERNQAVSEADDLRKQVGQLTLERNDLFNKREAAANALVEANRQIEILKTPTSPSPSIISVNDHLADLAARAKQNTINQINKNLARFEIPAINIPTLPEPTLEPINLVTEQEETAENIPNEIPTTDSQGDTSLEGNALNNPVVGQTESQVTRAEHEALSKRVDYLYTFANITEKAVA